MPLQNIYDINTCFSALANGDTNAFEPFFEAYKKRVFGVALKMLKSETEAEEIVQEVFLSIWQARERLDTISDPEAYLFTITHNAIYTQLKKISRNQQLVLKVAQRISEKQNPTEEFMAVRETGKLIQEAIRLLSPQQRAVYELSRQSGLSYQEIAEEMHISQNTVRNHLSVARKTIRTFLNKWALLVIIGMLLLFK